MRIDAEEKQFQLQLAVVSGQFTDESSIKDIQAQLEGAASDILEPETPVDNTNKLKQILRG